MNSELRNLAMLAKQRMKNANYNNKMVNNYSNKNNYFIKNVSAMKKKGIATEFITITNAEDLNFLKRVYKMLSDNEDIYNPIGKLVDNEYYKTLSNIEKQFYILRLSERYTNAREQYYKTKQL